MEDLSKKKGAVETDKDIIFSKTIKAGKRIYYLDVKRSRRNEMFIAITESKKVFSSEGDSTQVSFEKHKIFLYKEDFEKFTEGLQEALTFISSQTHEAPTEPESIIENSEEIKIDIDF